jgi:hypothetical protein
MKQSAVVLCEPETNPGLQWVEEVAALLPEESRLGWYQNVRPWLRMLPPDDEVAHLAYSMGYLALLTRTTPALVAAERVRLTATLERLSTEMSASVKTAADYHHRLNDRLGQLPGEIAKGIRPDVLADQIVASVREQFLNSGVTEAGRLVGEECDRLRQLMSGHTATLAEFRLQLKESRSRARDALDSIASSTDTAKKSIDLWNREMRQVQWMYLGLVLLLGALFYWWVVDPHAAAAPKQATATQQSQAAPKKTSRHAEK